MAGLQTRTVRCLKVRTLDEMRHTISKFRADIRLQHRFLRVAQGPGILKDGGQALSAQRSRQECESAVRFSVVRAGMASGDR